MLIRGRTSRTTFRWRKKERKSIGEGKGDPRIVFYPEWFGRGNYHIDEIKKGEDEN